MAQLGKLEFRARFFRASYCVSPLPRLLYLRVTTDRAATEMATDRIRGEPAEVRSAEGRPATARRSPACGKICFCFGGVVLRQAPRLCAPLSPFCAKPLHYIFEVE